MIQGKQFKLTAIVRAYRCSAQNLEEYQVTSYHNEHLIQVADCGSSACPLSHFLNFVKSENELNLDSAASMDVEV